MKKDSPRTARILGRRLAREISREELANLAGAADERAAVSTWTLTYPADGPYADGGGGGGYA